MATLNVPNVDKTPMMAHVYGNMAVKHVSYAVQIGAAVADVINFLRIPANVKILDFYETHDGGNTAATTANFGLAAVTGGPTTYVSATYFLSAADLNAAGRNRWGNTAVYPITTDGEYYLQAVLAGANTATAIMKVDIVLSYQFIGNL